jgi:hypothetical protein
MDFVVRLRRRGAWLLGISALMAAFVLSGNVPSDGARERCTSDVQLPITVRVLPEETPHPGAALRVRVEIEALRPFGEASVTVLAPGDVPVTAGRTRDLGPLAEHRPVEHEFAIIVPAHGQRRTVDVTVRAATDDGLTVVQGATLNLSFEDEPSRVVVDQNGAQVREVPARRIQ